MYIWKEIKIYGEKHNVVYHIVVANNRDVHYYIQLIC